MKKTIPLLVLSLLLSAATPPPALQSDTTGLYKALQEKLVLEQRIQKLEAESKQRDKDEEDLKEYLHDSQGILNFWSTVLGFVISLVGLGGIVAPYIIFKRSEKTKKEADDLLKSIQDMKGVMEEEHKKNIYKGQEEVGKLTSTGQKIIRSVEALSKAGDVNYFFEEQVKTILKELDLVSESEKTPLEEYLQEALEATQIKNFTIAIAAWKQILKQPSLGGAFLGPVFYAIGQAYLRLNENELHKNKGNLRLAEANLRASLAHQPESYRTIFFLAYTLDILGDLSGALSTYNLLLDFSDPPTKWPEVTHNNIALIKWRIQDFSGALDSFNKAIELNPNNISYYKDRSKLLIILNSESEAAADEAKAAELEAQQKPDSQN